MKEFFLHRVETNKCLNKMVKQFKESSSYLFKWFNSDYMKLNSSNIHLLLYGKQSNRQTEKRENEIEFQNVGDLVEIEIDSMLTFEDHIKKVFLALPLGYCVLV